MNRFLMLVGIAVFFLVGCENDQAKAESKAKQLAQLTCDSPREGRSQEELQAIGDSCFRKGSFQKSTPQSW
ncbi:hypothetical protein [Legionella quinlivanii]|uniref:hypothetical protein n=1 Tax=Legionella quinlivanii TaxID=45073 RepID=UPI002244C84A|nr:hypothetical protein [Legionella quinlivanii]MCW8452558.1 hypothetical protein [Legionella quinlivanii]